MLENHIQSKIYVESFYQARALYPGAIIITLQTKEYNNKAHIVLLYQNPTYNNSSPS